MRTDVFLTHNWGDKVNDVYVNHENVAKVNESLKAKGLLTWFDSDKMEGSIVQKMQEGIDNCNVVVVFITELYMKKVNGEGFAKQGDNCLKEFRYAELTKTNANMIAVVMDEEMCNPGKWKGMLNFVL